MKRGEPETIGAGSGQSGQSEQSNHVSSLVKALRNIPPDAKIITLDNQETPFVSVLVCARCPVLKKLYEDARTQCADDSPVVIKLQCSRRPAEAYIEYLQYDIINPDLSIRDLLCLYIMSTRYNQKELREKLIAKLLRTTSMFETAPMLYQICSNITQRSDIISELQYKAWKFIVRCIKSDYILKCDTCSCHTTMIKCGKCECRFWTLTPTSDACRCGVTFEEHINKLCKHTDPITKLECTGQLKYVRALLNWTDISDQTMSKILRSAHEIMIQDQ